MSKIFYYPCTCKSVAKFAKCTCLPEDVKKENLWLFHINNEHLICQNKKHKRWYKHQHHMVRQSPGWLSACRLPLEGRYPEKIRGLCKLLNWKCFCKNNLCDFCVALSENILILPNGNSLDLKEIEKLFPFLSFN